VGSHVLDFDFLVSRSVILLGCADTHHG
jgi:hypothetical protein